jgi:bifunctional ADP-heptose synthase (sugar kinase/adenylyltransferase)
VKVLGVNAVFHDPADAAGGDEGTPVAALERLAPDVFVKGAGYDAATLPESTASHPVTASA